MTELLRNAMLGWKDYTEHGKYAAVFLAVLLFLWMQKEKRKGAGLQMLYYSTVTAALVIFPFTAAALMVYQTRFYDYIWLFSYVPVTLMIAYGATILWQWCRDNVWKGSRWKMAAGIAFGVSVLILCGNLGGQDWQQERRNREIAEQVLVTLEQNGNTENICLWAPEEMMDYARALDGNIKLPYGRNMWETALDAYAYDVYDEGLKDMHLWMEVLTAPEWMVFERIPEIEECLQRALEAGVNAVAVPLDSPEEMLTALSEALEERQIMGKVSQVQTAGEEDMPEGNWKVITW